MKKKYFHPDPKLRELSGPQYWKSLDEVAETPEFREWVDREFPSRASELDGVDRRQFLKLMGASFAFAGLGLTGCRQPEQRILPYAKQPEHMIPGVGAFYATSMAHPFDNVPLIAETHEGRPTKLEGNPSYAPYGGSTDLFAQASILGLYDPDRSIQHKDASGQPLTRAQALDVVDGAASRYASNQGAGLAFLAEPSTSPSRERMVAALKARLPKALWCEYTPVRPTAAQKALKALTNQDLRPIYHLDKADRILCLEADFVQTEPGKLALTRDFSARRKVKDASQVEAMNRLYVAESTFSLTGGMADHRLRLPFSHLAAFSALVMVEFLEQVGGAQEAIDFLQPKGEPLAEHKAWVKACVTDLLQHKSRSVVIAGSQAPAAVQQLAVWMNQLLGAIGSTVQYAKVPELSFGIEILAHAIQLRKVETLVILDGNPVYDAPANLNWKSLQAKVPQVIRYGYYADETSEGAVHVAGAHFLESWGDGRTWDGAIVPVQPMILPLFDGIQPLEFLGRFLQAGGVDAYAYVKETFALQAPTMPFEAWLAAGVLEGSAYASVAPIFQLTDIYRALKDTRFEVKAFDASNLEVRFMPSFQVWDGRYANNGWLQECPESMTKLTWDNAILVSPKLAQQLQDLHGVPLVPEHSLLNKRGDERPPMATFNRGKEEAFIGELMVDGVLLKGPIHIQPGLPEFTVVVSLGYGRTHAGRVGDGVGFDVYPARKEGAMEFNHGSLKPTSALMVLANTQQHWSMEGRAIIREANAEDYAAHPDFTKEMCLESHAPANLGPDQKTPFTEVVKQIPRGNSAYETPPFTAPQQWGMVIDLSTCTGCNACVVACQSENNVPIVGKDQVSRGREMHWLRLDRYFSTGTDLNELPDDPQVSFMTMMCQHCELAPCESVCPVNATVHDEQGLNVMAYNRCVGTRYCANNCPYKVRRFNFFDWNKRDTKHLYEGPLGPEGMPELHKMQKNPNVTVRMRGVMEKCTYCVQRIESAKIRQLAIAKGSGNIEVPDGVIKTACQQVCPTGAIVFGDVANANTKVSEERASDRAYAVLGYLNIRPRTLFLARLRNPNPKMPDYHEMPLSRVEYEAKSGHHVAH
jgi:MoCo/4Fe-4S cofactor protein with predicted Tat translocation signal